MHAQVGINGVRILKIWRRYKSSYLDMIKCASYFNLSSEEQLLFTSCFPVVLTLKYGNEQKIKCIFFILFIHLNIQWTNWDYIFSYLFLHLTSSPSFEGTYAYVSFCIPCITASIYQQWAASSKSTFHPLIEPLCIHSALPLSKLRTTIRMLHVSLCLATL